MTTFHDLQAARIFAAAHLLDDALGGAIALVREERPGDEAARERLLDAAFGPDRFRKTCERLREGRAPARGLALVVVANGELIGTVRFWHVRAGRCDALLLGPLAIDARFQGCGLGGLMIRAGLERARRFGHRAVLLVGDAPYYERFGFSAAAAGALHMPGPVDRERFLALELEDGALAAVNGAVIATGALSGDIEDMPAAA